MDYIGSIYRPPSEANSLLIQVTVGCSHNRCIFCDMYRSKRFTTKPFEQIQADITEASHFGSRFRRVFLCDGDALILSTERLLRILHEIKKTLPWVERVGVYGDTRSVLSKSEDELGSLREAGLGIVYHGLESGSDNVLKFLQKGVQAEQAVEMAHRLKVADIIHSTIILLGAGGTKYSLEHIEQSTKIISRMDPRYVSALTLTIVPHTPLYEMQKSGSFILPDKFSLLGELRYLIANSNFSNCRFSANHASNYLPIRGELPGEKNKLLHMLDSVITKNNEKLLKPEYLRAL